MANTAKKILLVEGVDDQCFFKGFIKKYCPDLNDVDVEVLTPKDIDVDGFNSKQGALTKFASLTKDQAEKKFIGLIVDADLTTNGGGCSKFLQQVAQKLRQNGFEVSSDDAQVGLFKHPLHSCGVWVMPNNCADGSFEDWLLDVAQDKPEQDLLAYAKRIVDDLPSPTNFRTHDAPKAYMGTWLSWQASPRGGALNFFKDSSSLINENSPKFQDLTRWLNSIFIESL